MVNLNEKIEKHIKELRSLYQDEIIGMTLDQMNLLNMEIISSLQCEFSWSNINEGINQRKALRKKLLVGNTDNSTWD